MQNPKTIEHEGIVRSAINGLIKVSIISKSACVSCQAKGYCSISDMQEKEIEVYQPNIQIKEGETVNVTLEQKLGFKALFIGYLFPSFIVLISLIISLSITNNELFSGILSIALLIPYYLGIYLLRNKLKKTFSFNIKKLD